MTIVSADARGIAEAAERLRRGALVAFATETVYGLGADAENPAAVARVYAIKGRPADHPLIVHVSGAQAAAFWAELGSDALALTRAFWPGPLTLILRRREGVPAHACGGEPTIGLRCPSHPVAHALLMRFEALGGHGVAAPSANRFGRISPTAAQHVVDDLGADAWVLDGGPCEVGIESTIVDLSRGTPVVLRPGAITEARIRSLLAQSGRPAGEARGADAVAVAAATTATTATAANTSDQHAASGAGNARPAPPAAAQQAAPRASGTLPAHYAPRTPLELVAAPAFEFRLRTLLELGNPFAVLALRARPASLAVRPDVAWIEAGSDAAEYGRTLYARLRELDALRTERLLVERPPQAAEWEAILDRLARAAHAQDPRRAAE